MFSLSSSVLGTGPLPPTFGPTFSMVTELVNVAEDVRTQQFFAVDAERGVSNTTMVGGADGLGFDTKLIRNDINRTFMLATRLDGVQCYAFDTSALASAGGSPLPRVPTAPASATYLGRAVIGSEVADRYRVRARQAMPGGYHVDYVGSLAYQASPGGAGVRAPLFVDSGNNLGQTMTVTAFDVATPPSVLFDVPRECEQQAVVRLSGRTTAKAMTGGGDDENGSANAAALTSLDRLALADDQYRHNIGSTTAAPPAPRAPPPAEQSLPRLDAGAAAALPAAFDARDLGLVTNVRDQGSCGSCWAFSSAAAMEVLIAKKTAKATPGTVSAMPHLAPQALLDCVPDTVPGSLQPIIGAKGCHGGWPATGLHAIGIKDRGMPTEEDYPYMGVDGKCQPFAPLPYDGGNSSGAMWNVTTAYLPNDAPTIAASVVENGAVIATIQVLNDFVLYADGVYDQPLCTGTELSHGEIALWLWLLPCFYSNPLLLLLYLPRFKSGDHCWFRHGWSVGQGLLAGEEQFRPGVGRGRLFPHGAWQEHVRYREELAACRLPELMNGRRCCSCCTRMHVTIVQGSLNCFTGRKAAASNCRG